MRFAPRIKPLFVAGTIALHYLPEFIPVDRSKIKIATAFIPFLMIIRQTHAQHPHLLRAHVYKLLTQLVICFPFDLPFHALIGVRTFAVLRPEHHHGRPPPPVYRVLAHRFLNIASLA